MLIYNQAYDLFHTMFRILQITEKNKDILEIDKLRILDFYLAFPSELLEIKSFQGFKKYEKYKPFTNNEFYIGSCLTPEERYAEMDALERMEFDLEMEEEELIQFFIEQKILFLIPKFLSNKKN